MRRKIGEDRTPMNKSDIIKALSEKTELPVRKTEEIVNRVFDSMSESLVSGDRIEIRGFGSFSVRKYDGYTARDPRTGEKMAIQPKKLPFFKVGKDFRERLNQE